MEIPVVFISSTCEDLQETGYRSAARDAAIGVPFHPQMLEYWASRDNPPLAECMERVSQADVLVVIVAYRFGWVPEEQTEHDPEKCKSITWIECEQAEAEGREILAFLAEEGHARLVALGEQADLSQALMDGRMTPELAMEIQRRVKRLEAFKSWLRGRATLQHFTNVEDLRGKVSTALFQWCRRHGRGKGTPAVPRDPEKYLRLLRGESAYIDIRGLHVESGQAQRFTIDDLYIPLTTTLSDETETRRKGFRGKGTGQRATQERTPVELHTALEERLLVILGDPGSGKSTFLKRIACGLCNTRLGVEAKTTAEALGLRDVPLPLLVRLSDLVEHLSVSFGQQRGEPTTKASPAWLAHFLGARNEDGGTGLDQTFFQRLLKQGSAMVLLDGLDETPTGTERELIAELVMEAARCFEGCRFVVTTRPPAFSGRAILTGFAQVRIDPLTDSAIEGFLSQWCQVLFDDSIKQAEQHETELLHALASRLEIRRMARNPVMLTALAVVHWHEKRLPEQRADLYDSIIAWLSRARKRREGRLPAETCVQYLWELALAMHSHSEGRQVQVSRRWAAERLEGLWPGSVSQQKRIEMAERFLREEELDSGIVVSRGDDIRFWHLTFQEFLTARAISARSEKDQRSLLLNTQPKRLYESSWREVVLLLAGVLHKQGAPKVDGLVSGIIDPVWPDASLADQAHCVGLLGAIARDLSAVTFEPADPRYRQLLAKVMAIFDREGSRQIEIGVAIEAAEALGQAGDPRFVDAASDGNWVDLPAGEFLMGAQDENSSQPNYDSEAYDDESPVHRVYLDRYRIGRYPVVVAEYAKFIDAGGYAIEAHWTQGGFGKWQTPEDWEDQLGHLNRPVVGVSWFEAAAYARWAGKSLPTEAQWERAARGLQGRRYPWGDEDANPNLLNYEGSNINCAKPVGIYPLGATPEDIHDMAGNVREWCLDWFDENYYDESPKKDPRGPDSGSYRVLRGGSCLSLDRYCRGACRNYSVPSVRDGYIGFRLVSSSFGLGLPS